MNKKIIFAGIIVAGISTAFIAEHAMKGVDIASMDKKAKPQDDFYQYANGTWCKESKVPESEARWTSFNILAEKNNIILKKIMEDATVDISAKPGSNIQKIGDFYRTAMDTIKIDNQSFVPVLNDLRAINEIKTLSNLLNYADH